MKDRAVPQIFGHRGARRLEPENTLPSFRKALELGADGVELDVQLTADGRVVVIHDERLRRLSGSSLLVAELSFEALEKENVAAYLGDGRSGRVPLLEEVLELFQEEKRFLNIELKNSRIDYPGLEEKTLALVRAAGVEDQIIYSSFNHESVLRLSRIIGPAQCALLFEHRSRSILQRARDCQAAALHPDLRFVQDASLIEEAHRAGLRVRPWTVNENDDLLRLMHDGADAIITDEVERALALREDFLREADRRTDQ